MNAIVRLPMRSLLSAPIEVRTGFRAAAASTGACPSGEAWATGAGAMAGSGGRAPAGLGPFAVMGHGPGKGRPGTHEGVSPRVRTMVKALAPLGKRKRARATGGTA